MEALRVSRVCLIALLLAGCLVLACQPKAVVRPAVPDSTVRDLLREAESDFAAAHLHGWQRAEAGFAKAYALDRSPETLEKLLLTRFLIMTRRRDEDIVAPDAEETVKAICSAGGPGIARLCELARRYQEGYGATRLDPARAPSDGAQPPPFESGDAALDAYVRELYLRTHGIRPGSGQKDDAPNPHAESPLFLYLDVSRNTLKRAAELEVAHPGFAELLVLAAEDQFQKTRYNSAREYFRKALYLVPQYTRALNGLGNVYFYALEDFAKALEHYELALKQDSTNTTALFGMGAALHHLGRYGESSAAMDRVLESDLTRRGRAVPDSVKYHRSEAHFYKANNHYLLGNRGKAREFVDLAKAISPDLEHANYLSALLRYEAGEAELARTEFQELLRRGTSICRANYYLGRLLHEARDTRAADHFLAACSCMQRTIQTMEKQLQSVPHLDLEDGEKTAFQLRLDRKLHEFRVESSGLIEAMVRIVESSWDTDAKQYLGPMVDLLGRIRPQAPTEVSPPFGRIPP